jgi:hypothetical protein
MNRQRFFRRVVLPAAFVLAVMIISTNIYDLSRHVESRLLHGFLANGSAVFMFLSIWLGAFFANTLLVNGLKGMASIFIYH